MTDETDLDRDLETFRRLCRHAALLHRCRSRNEVAVQRILARYELGSRLYPFADEAPARTLRVMIGSEQRKTFATSLLSGPSSSQQVTEDGKYLWLLSSHGQTLKARRDALQLELARLLDKYGLTPS